MDKERTRERTAYIAMLLFFAALLLVGTFFDEAIARVLYSPHNVVATLVTTTGIYPFFSSVVLFMGVICQRVSHSGMAKVAKAVACIVAVLVALFVGFIGAAAIVDTDCLGGILPSLNKNYPVIAVLTLVIEYPLFLVGYKLAGRTDDQLLLKRVVCLVAVLLAAFVFMQLVKGVFNRPRFRVVAEGLEGVGFVPWYRISPDPSGLMASYGLDKNEFASFPSGHAILSISSVYIMLSLTWLLPGLRGRRLTLCIAGFVFGVVIMFSRMVLGAHYLSDVSAGALIGIAFVLLYNALQRGIDRSEHAAAMPLR